MQATCTLCGDIFQVIDDVRGASYTVGALGTQVKHHIGTKHANTRQTVISDPALLPAEVTLPQLITVMGLSFQGLIVFSYFQSEDPLFQDQMRMLRELLDKIAAQKAVAAPVVIA